MSDESSLELTPIAERISGPVAGYYLASYALMVSPGYEGYVKIFDAAPSDVWDCHAVCKVASGRAESVDTALELAETVALAAIVSLKHFAGLGAPRCPGVRPVKESCGQTLTISARQRGGNPR